MHRRSTADNTATRTRVESSENRWRHGSEPRGMRPTSSNKFFSASLTRIVCNVALYVYGYMNLCVQKLPYQAELIIYASSGTYLCGGTVISASFIATAAHCVTDAGQSHNGPVLLSGLSIGITVGQTALNYWPPIKVRNDSSICMATYTRKVIKTPSLSHYSFVSCALVT